MTFNVYTKAYLDPLNVYIHLLLVPYCICLFSAHKV